MFPPQVRSGAVLLGVRFGLMTARRRASFFVRRVKMQEGGSLSFTVDILVVVESCPDT